MAGATIDTSPIERSIHNERPSCEADEHRHVPISRVQVISPDESQSVEDARTELMRSVVSQLDSSNEDAILRPLDVATRMKLSASPIVWAAIGGPSDEDLAGGSADKGIWARSMHQWFAEELGRQWIDKERQYNKQRVNGRHMRGLCFAEVV